MTVHQFPARYQPKDSEARRAMIAQRNRVRDAMVDMLAVMARHRLDEGEDVELLALILGTMAHAHGVAPDLLAFAAVSSAAVAGIPDASA